MRHNLQRQVFLYSAILHIILLGSLMEVQALLPARTAPPEPVDDSRVVARLIPPPASVLRDLAVNPTPAPNTAPTPPPPPPTRPTPPPASDRMSVGAQAAERAKVLELRRDEDIRKRIAQGDTLRAPAPTPEPPSAAATPQTASTPEPGRSESLPPSGNRPTLPLPGPSAPPKGASDSIAASAERRVEAIGRQGLSTGVGRQMGPLFFDPEGADFTLWVEHLRTEIFRNWIVPQSAMFGFGTHADFEFVVERDGRVSSATLVKSSGVPALDRAAQNALIASRPQPLPKDFTSPRLVLQVSFIYNVERG